MFKNKMKPLITKKSIPCQGGKKKKKVWLQIG